MSPSTMLLVAVTLVIFVWYFAGTWINRRRSGAIIGALRAALAGYGEKPAIKWFGRSAFEIELQEPRAPVTGLRMLCLLEPRDFPLALLWNRLRGRRDQLLIHMNLARTPARTGGQDPASFGVVGLTSVKLAGEVPHVELSLQLGRDSLAAIGQALEVARRFAPGK